MPAGILERGKRGPNGERAAVDVRQHHRAPVLGSVLQEAPLGSEAGIGERDVDAAKGIEGLRSERLLIAPLRDVTTDGQRPVGAELF